MEVHRLVGIPWQEVEANWSAVAPYLAKAFVGGEFELEDIKQWCIERKMQLWALSNGTELVGAGTTEIVVYPRRKVVRAVLFAGGSVEAWARWQEPFERWAKEQGADCMQTLSKRGFHRLLKPYGFEHLYEVLSKEL